MEGVFGTFLETAESGLSFGKCVNRLWDGLVHGLLGHSGRTPGETPRAPGQHLPPPAMWSTSVVDMSVVDVKCWQAAPILGAGGRRRGHRAHPSPRSPQWAQTLAPKCSCPPQPPCPACWLSRNGSCSSVCVQSLQSRLTLRDPRDCSLPGSSVRGILQARALERVAMPSSRGSSRPGDHTYVSYVSCIGRRVL